MLDTTLLNDVADAFERLQHQENDLLPNACPFMTNQSHLHNNLPIFDDYKWTPKMPSDPPACIFRETNELLDQLFVRSDSMNLHKVTTPEGSYLHNSFDYDMHSANDIFGSSSSPVTERANMDSSTSTCEHTPVAKITATATKKIYKVIKKKESKIRNHKKTSESVPKPAEPTKVYACKHCTATFDSSPQLGGHTSRHHRGESTSYKK